MKDNYDFSNAKRGAVLPEGATRVQRTVRFDLNQQIDDILLDEDNDGYVDCSCCDWATTASQPCPRVFKFYFWFGSSFELNYSVLFKTYSYQLWFKHRLIWLIDGLEEW